MTAYEVIARKRRGKRLTRQEIQWFIRGYLDGDIADYQVAAWLMAVTLQGMDPDETWDLTEVMAFSGERLHFPYPTLDKHSTGGVADTTTLVVVPLVSSLGIPVVKLSGRGLGHTGGTIDKLEAIPGLETALSPQDIHRVLEASGMVIAGQSARLAPADGHLYALRDVTATVDSVPLIAASIMSKKLAAGASGVVLDVKTGSGAILPELTQARELARTLVAVGSRGGINTRALLTCMDQPLGRAVGNAVEVQAALEVLGGGGPRRLVEVCLSLAAELAAMGGAASRVDAYSLVSQKLASGAAREQFARWLRAQGGDERIVDEPDRLPRAAMERVLTADRPGFVTRIDARQVGMAAVRLGAGRRRKEDRIDPGAGIILEVEEGTPVSPGAVLARLRFNHGADVTGAVELMGAALDIGEAPPAVRSPVLEAIR